MAMHFLSKMRKFSGTGDGGGAEAAHHRAAAERQRLWHDQVEVCTHPALHCVFAPSNKAIDSHSRMPVHGI